MVIKNPFDSRFISQSGNRSVYSPPSFAERLQNLAPPNDPYIVSESNIFKTVIEWGFKLGLLFLAYLIFAPFINGLIGFFFEALNVYAWVILIFVFILFFALMKAVVS